MLKVLDAILLSTDYLKKKGIDEARLNSELMLADILGFKRLNLYLNYDKPLSEKETNLYREYLARRGKFEPVQYILGYTEFWNYKFFVDKSVLIPRPDTEILVETIINDYKTYQNTLSILDIGTGSGIIAICLAKNLNCKVTAIDISLEALTVAQNNANFNNIDNNITFKQVDVLKSSATDFEKYDIIVSNPPYVSSIEFENLQKEITEFEPKIAVTDYDDGYIFYKKISKLGTELLNDNGKVYFEIAKDTDTNLETIMKENKYKNIKKVKDYANIYRVITGEI
ncbi:MAG: peptide chain release factor N(5)-glutamine methyltransferase [bacterium]